MREIWISLVLNELDKSSFIRIFEFLLHVYSFCSPFVPFAMPHSRRSHADSKKVVCATCMRKTASDLRNISSDTCSLIWQHDNTCKMSNKGLGFYSDQASETVHGDFNRLWTNYKVSSFENPRYKEQLLKAVQMYNSRHLLWKFRDEMQLFVTIKIVYQ